MQYELKTVDGLRTLALTSSGWDDSILDLVSREKIEYLSVAGVDSDIAFVRHLGGLKRLVLSVARPRDLRPLEELVSVRELHLQLGPGRTPPVALGKLSQLEDLGTDWLPGLESIGACYGLSRLVIGRPPAGGLGWLSGLTQLSRLQLSDGRKLETLTGCEALQSLRSLELTSLQRLHSLDGVETLSGLRKLDVTTCKRIDSIEQVRGLDQLTALAFDNCGQIESIAPLATLSRLESFFAVEDTRIADGDLSPLLLLRNLKRVGMMDRRSYRPSLAEVRARLGIGGSS